MFTKPLTIPHALWEAITPVSDRLGIITLTPDVAKYLQDRAGDNRKLKSTQVQRLTDVMRAGRFQNLTGGGILLDTTGKLRGGQHRIEAVIQSGCTVVLYIRWDLSEVEINAENEGGIPWSAADMDLSGLPHRKLRASLTRSLLIMDYEGSGAFGMPYKKWAPDKLLVASYDADPRVLAAAQAAAHIRNQGLSQIFDTGMGFAYASIKNTGLGDPAHFFESLATGANLPVGSPILALRKYFVGENFAKNRKTWQVTYATVKAWNAYVRDERLTRIDSYVVTETRVSKPEVLIGWKPFFTEEW